MLKKLTLLAMSVGALLAIAAPAAQATGPLITDSDGNTPTYITAVSNNFTIHTVGNRLECTTFDLTLHLTQNALTTVKGHGGGHATGTRPAGLHSGHCGAASGLIVEFTNVTVNDIHLTKHGGATTGTATFTFTFHLRTGPTPGSLIAECTLGGTVPVVKTESNDVNATGKITKTGGSAFCPTEGELTSDFELFNHGSYVDAATIH